MTIGYIEQLVMPDRLMPKVTKPNIKIKELKQDNRKQ
jgi:hypothetical protein